MSDKPLALAAVPPVPAALADYDAICATVMASERGRWFLQEYARRNRNADTRLVLAAIERIEALIRGQQSYQDLRVELLDMAKTIAVTRAEIAEIAPGADRKGATAANARSAPDVFAAAERVQEVAWTMRERGLDPATCDQIEALATSILSNAALCDPNDRRARKLGEVLHYLGRRIEGMLEGSTSIAAATHADPPSRDSLAAVNGHAAGDPAAADEIAATVRAADAEPDITTSAEPAPRREAVATPRRDAPLPASNAIEADAQPNGAATTTPAAVTEPASSPAERAGAPILPVRPGPRPLPAQPLAPPPGDAAAFDVTAEIDEDLFAAGPAEAAAQPGVTSPAAVVDAPAPVREETPAAAAHAIAAAGVNAGVLLPAPTAEPASNDLIAALKAMSDEERIALFT